LGTKETRGQGDTETRRKRFLCPRVPASPCLRVSFIGA